MEIFRNRISQSLALPLLTDSGLSDCWWSQGSHHTVRALTVTNTDRLYKARTEGSRKYCEFRGGSDPCYRATEEGQTGHYGGEAWAESWNASRHLANVPVRKAHHRPWQMPWGPAPRFRPEDDFLLLGGQPSAAHLLWSHPSCRDISTKIMPLLPGKPEWYGAIKAQPSQPNLGKTRGPSSELLSQAPGWLANAFVKMHPNPISLSAGPGFLVQWHLLIHFLHTCLHWEVWLLGNPAWKSGHRRWYTRAAAALHRALCAWSPLTATSHGGRCEPVPGSSFLRTISPIRGFCVRDLITSQRPHLLITSPWGSRFQLMNFGGKQTWILVEGNTRIRVMQSGIREIQGKL